MKIKYLIDTILSPQITALEFADKYAGIVKTINIAVDNQTETGTIKRYPVACNVQGDDCANVGIYGELVPDDTKKSVIYWELIQPMTNTGYTKTKDFFNKRFKGTARLIVWLNLAKLGIDECNGAILTLPILEKILTQKGKLLSGVYENSLLWIEPKSLVKQDINTIFGSYDYPKLKNYYLYPYDFFAIDVNFTLEQCLSKGGTFPILPAADCVNVVPSSAICKSFSLDGFNEYILPQTGFLSAYDRTAPLSFGVWVKPVSFGPIDIILHKYDPFTETGFLFYWNNSQILCLDFLQGTVTNSFRIQGGFAVTMLSGIWQHIAFTFDGTDALGMNIYYNGVQKIRITVSNTLATSIINTANTEIGGISSINIYNNVIINVSRMWDIELTPAEIAAEYNTGVPLPAPVQSGNLLMNMNGATGANWDGLNFVIPDPTAVTTGYASVNLEEIDAVEDCP